MKSTDFLKKPTKEDKVIYSYGALCNLVNALRLSYNEAEYFEFISEFSSDLSKYLNNLSLILRSLGINCKDLQFKTCFDYNNEDYLILIADNLQPHYGKELISCLNRRINSAKKIDLALLTS